jgi:hypothetical protein
MCTFHLLLWVGFAMAQYPARERVTEESIKLYRLATSPEKTRSIFSSPSCLCMRHFVLRTWWHVAWHNFFNANSRRLLIVLLVLERVRGCICHPTFHRGCRGFLRSQFDVKIWGLSYTVLILYLYCTYTVLILSCHLLPIHPMRDQSLVSFGASAVCIHGPAWENRAPGKILARTPTIVYMKLCGGMRIMQWPIQNLAACDDGRPLWAYMTKTYQNTDNTHTKNKSDTKLGWWWNTVRRASFLLLFWNVLKLAIFAFVHVSQRISEPSGHLVVVTTTTCT